MNDNIIHKNINCISSTFTDLECDVVECNPFNDYNDLIVIGTYHLKEDTKQRVGEIILYKLINDNINEKDNYNLKNLYSINRAGVLDCRWNKTGDHIITAEADGKIGLFSLQDHDNNTETINFITDYEFNKQFNTINTNNPISLAVDWNYNKSNKAISSYSNGYIITWDINENINKENSFIAHENAEVWAISYSKHSPNLFYSGGDDGKLLFWDDRLELNTCSPIARKRYDMGVTCIQSNPFNEYQIVVGSYDESICIYDTRKIRNEISKIKVGGGIWRLKWNPYHSNIILSACMYNQFQLIEYNNNTLTKINNEFGSPYHTIGKLAYGADWLRINNPSNNYLALSSFYDKAFSCWKLSLE